MDRKTCNRCLETKCVTLFQKVKSNRTGYGAVCQPCVNSKQREYRQKTGDSSTKLYEKTLNGYLMRTYRNMKSRVVGIQKLKSHLYEGLDIMSKEDFYDWSLGSKHFHELYNDYLNSGFSMKAAPSIDRLDTSKGYIEGNVRWITHSENSRLGAVSRHNKENYL